MKHRILGEILGAITSGNPGFAALIATAAGTQISGEVAFQIVTPVWGAVDNILILPSPVQGMIIVIAGTATGGEIRTSAPATIGINGGTGTNAESAIAANMMVLLICESATNWKGLTIASNGVVTTLQVAAP